MDIFQFYINEQEILYLKFAYTKRKLHDSADFKIKCI